MKDGTLRILGSFDRDGTLARSPADCREHI
jgi:hypothetical protein